MSKKRYVDTKFWDDSYIMEKDPIEKLLFLYLLTNTLTNIIGIYEISDKRIAFDTGIDKEMVIKILERFEEDDKIKYENGWIAIKNFTKHQLDNPKINAGMKKLSTGCPQNLINWANIDYDRLSHPNTNLNLNTNKNLNREKKDKKESVDPSAKKTKKEGKEPLEFSFKEKQWWGLYDWRIKMYQGAFPMLKVNYLFHDLWKTKFLSDPEKYKKMIKEQYEGKIDKLVWAWLNQEKKIYLKDHPIY